MLIIEGYIERELTRIAKLRAPKEAVGLILGDYRVFELPNHAEDSETRFEVHKDDILKLLERNVDLMAVTFWHSHPAGGVGPSRFDMRHKSMFVNHLVVALVEGELVPTWY